MADKNFKVKNGLTVGGDDFVNYIRVSMGIPEDTDAFLRELKDVLGRLSTKTIM